jgi:flagellar biosynthesis protein FlhF
MKTRTYQAKTMAAALAEVKRDLGRDAVILQTRSFRKGGLLGVIGGKPMWEVTATPHINLPSRVPRGQYLSVKDPARSGGAQPLTSERPEPAAVPERAAPPRLPDQGVSQQISEIRNMLETVLSQQRPTPPSEVSPVLSDAQTELLRRDVEEGIATDLMRELQGTLSARELSDRGAIRRKLLELVEMRIPTVGSDSQVSATDGAKVIALIGPTGVGKTTTIAKLAANLKLRENKRVGLITVDTYRIAAVDQLRTYAEIIEVPIHPVLTAGELHQGIHAMRDLDVVLIDTAGRSQNDQLRLNQLRGFLSAAHPDEVHLLVSATANCRCAKSTLERFVPLGANRIIISKLDEAETPGMILSITGAKVPLSYVTTGQDVPDDISVVDTKRLAQWIVGDERYAD